MITNCPICDKKLSIHNGGHKKNIDCENVNIGYYKHFRISFENDFIVYYRLSFPMNGNNCGIVSSKDLNTTTIYIEGRRCHSCVGGCFNCEFKLYINYYLEIDPLNIKESAIENYHKLFKLKEFA